jgi:hypothetical protein
MNRFALTTALLFCATLAPAAAQQAPTPEKSVTLTVSVPEAQKILNDLAAEPWRDANQLMQKLATQINAQLVPPDKKK